MNLQIVNGGTFAALYLITGNLAVSIITHALYDFYIFYKTHLVDVAGQMAYAEEQSLMPICSSKAVENKWIMERGEDWLIELKESFYLADTNRDGGLSRKELRIALYSYGINLSKVESQIVKQVADIDVSGSIDFDEVRIRVVKFAAMISLAIFFSPVVVNLLTFISTSILFFTMLNFGTIVLGIYWSNG